MDQLTQEQLTATPDRMALTAETETWLRGIARVISVIVVAGFAVALYRYGAPGADDYVAWEETASIVVLGVAAAGLAIAWWLEGVGGAIALVAGTFVGAISAYRYDLLLALAAALAFVIPAALFLLAWQRTRTIRAIVAVVVAAAALLAVGAGAAAAFYERGQGPSHPASTRSPLPDSPVTWIWSGGVSDSTATVVATVDEAHDVRLAYGPDLDRPRYATASLRGPVYRFTLENLTPATTYRYAVEVDGELDLVRAGELATFAEGPADLTVAFGACARVGSNGSVFDAIGAMEPDLFIASGDLFYGDVMDNSLDAFADLYGQSLSTAAQQALYASVPMAYTWDDHDYGPNDAGGDSPSRGAALASYRTMVPSYAFALDGPDAPIAQAFTIGRVRFILTDTRSARDVGAGTMLGEEQLGWFLDELAAAASDHALVVWVSSVPWIGEPQPGSDDWSGFDGERRQIAELIEVRGIDNLIMLAGDAHMVAIDDGSNNDYGSFPVMQAGALDRPGSIKGGPYSEGTFAGGGQFGVLRIADDGSDTVEVTLSGHTWEGTEPASLQLSFVAEAGS